ncbi:MAG: metallophosphoesterase family protein [Nitrososphaerota archaeon]
MKLLHVSDIHGSVEMANRVAEMASKGFDAVLAAGDITHFGNTAQAEDILGRIGGAGVPVYFVAGNCDPEILLSWRPRLENVFNIHLGREKLGGLELLGLGGGNTSPFNTIIEFTEDQFREMLASLNPSGRAILVSHTPPYGTAADFARGRHLGSKAIREYVERAKPLAVCCGHIHEGRAVDSIGSTKVVNAGPAKDGYCASLSISHDSLEISLLRL